MWLILFTISLLPLKGSYIGVKVTSFSHLPSKFSMELPVHNSRIGIDLDINYSSIYTSNQSSAWEEANTKHMRRKAYSAELGFQWLSLYGGHQIRNFKVTGLLGFRPFVSYLRSEERDSSFNDSTSASFLKSNTYRGGINLKSGAQFQLKVFNVPLELRLLVTPLSFSYEKDKTETDGKVDSEFHHTSFSGLQLTSGFIEFWLLLKI